MANDLIELLRRPYGNLTFGEREQVASTIEALQAENARLKEPITEIVNLLWSAMGRQEDVGPHGGYIYMKLRAAITQLDAEHVDVSDTDDEFTVDMQEHEDGSATITIDGLTEDVKDRLVEIGVQAMIASYAINKTPEEMFVDIMKEKIESNNV